jgi:hypothetical protein
MYWDYDHDTTHFRERAKSLAIGFAMCIRGLFWGLKTALCVASQHASWKFAEEAGWQSLI